jgi:tRNA pseudouridine synthase B-like protein
MHHPANDGVLVVDKPSGITSHDVVAIARRALREKRIGHTGTLDPIATGVLPLACGRATRLVRFLVASDKDYDAVIRFGLVTDSYDVTGTEDCRHPRVRTGTQRRRRRAVPRSGPGDTRRSAPIRWRGRSRRRHVFGRVLCPLVRARPRPAPWHRRVPCGAAADAERPVCPRRCRVHRRAAVRKRNGTSAAARGAVAVASVRTGHRRRPRACRTRSRARSRSLRPTGSGCGMGTTARQRGSTDCAGAARNAARFFASGCCPDLEC